IILTYAYSRILDPADLCQRINCPDPSFAALDEARSADPSEDSGPAAQTAIPCVGQLFYYVSGGTAVSGLDHSSHWAIRLCWDGWAAHPPTRSTAARRSDRRRRAR